MCNNMIQTVPLLQMYSSRENIAGFYGLFLERKKSCRKVVKHVLITRDIKMCILSVIYPLEVMNTLLQYVCFLFLFFKHIFIQQSSLIPQLHALEQHLW